MSVGVESVASVTKSSRRPNVSIPLRLPLAGKKDDELPAGETDDVLPAEETDDELLAGETDDELPMVVEWAFGTDKSSTSMVWSLTVNIHNRIIGCHS